MGSTSDLTLTAAAIVGGTSPLSARMPSVASSTLIPPSAALSSMQDGDPDSIPLSMNTIHSTVSRTDTEVTGTREQRYTNLPPEMAEIVAKHSTGDKFHDLGDFKGGTYSSFWRLSPGETHTMVEFDKLGYKEQSVLFEVFSYLLRMRFNVNRMVNHYGELFKKAKDLTTDQTEDYNKVFGPLSAFGKSLERVILDVKPMYDNTMFVDGKSVIKVIRHWLKRLKKHFATFSKAIIYLVKLSTTASVRQWIATIEEDVLMGHGLAANVRSLFTTYFLTFLAHLREIIGNLNRTYTKMEKKRMMELTGETFAMLTEMNKATDNNANLDKKIKLNDKLHCSDYVYMEIVDMFDNSRKLNEPVEDVNIFIAGHWQGATIAVLDNYFLPLLKEQKPKESKDPNDFITTLRSPPAPIQYVIHEKVDLNADNPPVDGSSSASLVADGNSVALLTVTDPGNANVYKFKYVIPEGETDPFVRMQADIRRAQADMDKRSSQAYCFKMINCNTFYSKPSTPKYPFVDHRDRRFNLVDMAIRTSFNKPVLPTGTAFNDTCVNCVEFFRYPANTRPKFIAGTNNGLYVGEPDDPSSWRLGIKLPNITKMATIDGSVLVLLAGESLKFVPIEAIGRWFTGDEFCKNMHENWFKPIGKGKVKGFEVGYQTDKDGEDPVDYLFFWKDKTIRLVNMSGVTAKYLKPEKMNIIKMRATFTVRGISLLYPDRFVIMHVNENNPIFYMSDLRTMTNLELPYTDEDKELKLKLRENAPISAFRLSLGTGQRYEVILVYSRYCVFVSWSMEKKCFKRSRNEVIRFSFDVTGAAFDPAEHSLTLTGDQNVEVWNVSLDKNERCEMVSYAIGNDVRLVNTFPGKIIVAMNRTGEDDIPGNQLILHLRKVK
ncbi:unnamed protein product [Ambrosiozyma monospora]|uniref:Unnamed protein product n=1 Tax=Ambrosiozyma monospora TaxID=43982 RepID=A0A9W6YT05_AMBMO|nr:unnamed protein product [Ambrosiozyma monospora]